MSQKNPFSSRNEDASPPAWSFASTKCQSWWPNSLRRHAAPSPAGPPPRMRIFMGDPAKIAEELESHLHDLAVVNAVRAASSGLEMNRFIFPAQVRFALERDRQRNIL